MSQVQVYWILLCDPQYSFVPAGSNEETETSLGPVSEEGTRSPEPGIWDDSRTLEERAVAGVQEHDWTPGEGVACDASQGNGRPLYRCQSLIVAVRTKHDVMLTWCQRCFRRKASLDIQNDVGAECWTAPNVETYEFKEQTQRHKKEGCRFSHLVISGLS